MGFEKKYSFDILFVKRFWQIQKLLFPKWKSLNTMDFAFLLLVEIFEEIVGYYVGLLSGRFYKDLTNKDIDAFLITLVYSLGLISIISVIKTIRMYLNKLLIVGWRNSLTKKLHEFYFTDVRFYHLHFLGDYDALDNADQRITADVHMFCTTYGIILTDVLISPFTISYYTYDAYTRTGWIGPVGMFIFFILSTILNKFLMSPIVNLAAEQEKREGDFRYKHVTTKVNAENLAFSGTANVEHTKTNKKLVDLCHIQKRVYNNQFFLNLATNTFQYLSSIMSYLVIAGPIFSGYYDSLDSGELSQLISENAFVCINLVYQFSKLVRLASVVSDMAGVTHRIAELLETLTKLPDKHANSFPYLNNKMVGPQTLYSLLSVSYGAPNMTENLVTDLTLDINVGKNILVMGQSSSGKSSLFRVLRGLWPLRSGEIRTQNSTSQVLFFPQRLYLTEGSLKEQIIYPLKSSEVSLSENELQLIHAWIEDLGLTGVFSRCDKDLEYDPGWNWYDALSPGEIQRLAFIRLFYHHPTLAFLDEATSALSLDMESKLMHMCREMNITLVSIGHRESLKSHHQLLLTLGKGAEGQWELSDI